ncbi:MAG: carbohydrate binding domain-containing protein [Clostridia bacterium]|nr:carbohydrate binding domain-containing protein [Clostridia bacterium]
MKKGIKTFCKVLSVFLAVLFVIEILPLQVMAEEFTDAVEQKEFIKDLVNNPTDAEKDAEAEILYEVEEKRDEHTKVYKKSDGTYTAVMTEEPLHYLDEGVWKEIDNSMLLYGGQYTNIGNDFNVELPKNIDENQKLTVEKDGEELSFSIDNIKNSSAVVENNIATSDSEIELADKAISQTQSSVTYNNITDNTDLQYIVTPNSIKENIIVSSKESVKNIYTFTFETNGLNTEKQNDGSIFFKDNNDDIKFIIPRPVMTDANLAFSYDIVVSLIENANGTITLEYAPSIDWTSSNDRVYPITIDPAILVYSEEPGFIEDTSVGYNSNEPEHADRNNIDVCLVSVVNMLTEQNNGVSTTYDSEIYTRINTDFFKNLGNDIVFTEVQYISAGSTSTNGKLFAREIVSSWNANTVTYNTKPQLSNSIIDYYTSPYKENEEQDNFVFVHFNITEHFNNWFNGKTNNGFAITAAEDTAAIMVINGGSERTMMVMDYVDLGGYNENLNYHSQSAGRAGTGYVNDFTQNLSVLRDDISINGNIMPVTVGMIYDSATYATFDTINSNMLAYGTNWIPNYLRAYLLGDENQVTYYTDTGTSIDYTYSIENGEVVFKEVYSDIYGEHGYEIKYFAATDTEAESVIMTRPDGYVEKFNSDGFLVSVTNPDYPEQSINVVYDSRTRIDYITDGVGRKYDYIYDTTTNLLSKVKCYSSNSIAITASTTELPLEVSYAYDSNKNLTGVTYPDGKSITYAYDSNGNITSMTNIDGYRVKYDYDSNGKVTKITEQAYNGTDYIDGNFLTYERLSSTQIKLTDGTENFEIYHFGIKGNLLYSVDNFGNYFVNEDSGSTDETYFISSSDYRVNSQNLLKNPSFEEQGLLEESPKGWETFGSPFIRETDANAHFGDYVLKVKKEDNDDDVVEQTVPVLSGGYYTLSAYIKADVTEEQILNIKIYSLDGSNKVGETGNEIVGTTSGSWKRYTVTINAPKDTEKIVVELSTPNGGIFCVDDIQLEQSLSASSYNYLTDGGFRKDLDYWTGSEDFTTTESSINGEVANAVTLPGGTDAENTIYQTVTINGKKDDVFTVGGWLKGCFVNSVTNNTYLLNVIAESSDPKICNFTNDRYAQIEVSYQYTEITGEGTEEEKTETLTETIVVPFAENVNDWQFATQNFALKGDCETITILVRYSKNANSALISNIELSKDEDAVVISEDKDTIEEETTSCSCDGCEEPKCPCRCESEVSCTCEYCKLRKTTETTDSFGNITSNSSFDGVKTIETVSKYTDDGNYLTSETDADGNEVFYGYDTLNGILETVTDANGNKTTYSYDANGLLTQVSADNSLTSTANYVYNNDRLIAITHNGFTYNLTYNIWGQLEQVLVGTQPIISYKYGAGATRDRIKETTYYNGDFENSKTTVTEYRYENGNISQVIIKQLVEDELVTVKKHSYEYDSFANLIAIKDSNNRQIKYTGDRTDIVDLTTERVIYSSDVDEDGNIIEIIGGIEYTSKSYESEYDIENGITTEFNDVSTSNGKVIGTIDKQDWFGRYTESIVKTESAKDENSDNNFASVKTEYAYPEYADNKTSNRIESYSNTITYGTDTSEENKTDYYGFAYDYDANGNIIAEYKQGINGAKTLRYSYVYDELNQLVRVNDKVANVTYVYEYDSAGNITKKYEYIYTTDEEITAEPENVILYTYDEVWKDKLATYDGKEFTYDSIGNPLTFDGASFSWSGRELTQYSKDGKTISFQYDENGLRHRKIVKENDVIVEQYDYVWSDGALISQTYTNYENETILSTSTARFIYDTWGTLQGFILNDSEVYLYVKNLQGDIIAIVDEFGEVIVEYSYDAWGNVTFHETSLQNMTKASTLCFVSPFTYRSYCYDYDIELYYLQSRYYSAEIGRFINTDDTQIAIATMGTVLGANLFAYCENNPIVYVDYGGTAKYSITAIGVQIEISASFLGFAGEIGIEFVFVLSSKKFYVYVYAGSGLGYGYTNKGYNFFKNNLKFMASKPNISLTNIKNLFSLNVSFSIGLFLVKTTSKFSWPNSYTIGTSTSNSLSVGKGKGYTSKASNGTYKCYGLCLSFGGAFGLSKSVVVNTRFSSFLTSLSTWLQKRKNDIIKLVD